MQEMAQISPKQKPPQEDTADGKLLAAGGLGAESCEDSSNGTSTKRPRKLVFGKYGMAFCGIQEGIAFLGKCRKRKVKNDSEKAEVADSVEPSTKKRKLNQVGIVYDRDMEMHRGTGTHPERPERIRAIWTYLEMMETPSKCKRISAVECKKEHVDLCHKAGHWEECNSLIFSIFGELPGVYVRNDMFWNEHTSRAARLSAGSVIDMTNRVLRGELDSGFALVRPPGHHAGENVEGFCWFNNVALAAREAQKQFDVKRVMILDWDVHHGNGTQDIFYNDPSVLYVSLHRYEPHFYPGTGDVQETGGFGCEGTTVNIPWASAGMGDVEYMSAFERIIFPVAKEFDPELILVSAGFDAADGDPLGGMTVTPGCFGWMTEKVMKELPNAKLILALEGGYNLGSISRSAHACICALLGDDVPYQMPHIEAQERKEMLKTLKAQSQTENGVTIEVIEGSDEKTESQLKEPMIVTPPSIRPPPGLFTKEDEINKELEDSNTSDTEESQIASQSSSPSSSSSSFSPQTSKESKDNHTKEESSLNGDHRRLSGDTLIFSTLSQNSSSSSGSSYQLPTSSPSSVSSQVSSSSSSSSSSSGKTQGDETPPHPTSHETDEIQQNNFTLESDSDDEDFQIEWSAVAVIEHVISTQSQHYKCLESQDQKSENGNISPDSGDEDAMDYFEGLGNSWLG